MFRIFDRSVLTDFEKYEKITWLPVMWTYRTIQFWVPPTKIFYPEILFCAVAFHVQQKQLLCAKTSSVDIDK